MEIRPTRIIQTPTGKPSLPRLFRCMFEMMHTCYFCSVAGKPPFDGLNETADARPDGVHAHQGQLALNHSR